MKFNNPIKYTLHGCRSVLNRSNRSKLAKDKMPMPAWLRADGDENYVKIYKEQGLLLKHGVVVWGAVIQANSMLFEAGDDDHPAAILYSFDSRIELYPDILRQAARDLFSFKGQRTGDPEVQDFADKLEDETVSDLKLPVPSSLTQGIECFYTSLMFHRHHFPDKKLSVTMLPILASAKMTDVVMALPSNYWPKRYSEMWVGQQI